MSSVDTKASIRALVRGAYDIQKLRIQAGNRIVTNFKAKLGQVAGSSEEELEAVERTLLADLRNRYKKLAHAISKRKKQTEFKGDAVISSATEFFLIGEYLALESAEEGHFKQLERTLKGVPIWSRYLSGVKGIGPALAGVLISEIDIARARYPSSLWKYAGLDVAGDGRGRSRRAEHLVTVSYTNGKGTPDTRQSITFNPFLKTKLMGVLASSFLRSANEPYAAIYADYKHRLESNPVHQEKSKGHRHNMALRYMLKMFLVDLYREWRALEGLTVSAPYAEGKLGMHHAVLVQKPNVVERANPRKPPTISERAKTL